jgi:hypothetical protein
MKKSITTIIVLTLFGIGGLLVWQNQNERTKAAKLDAEILKGLTAQEIALVLKSEATADREAIVAIKENPDKRRAFLDGMREHLALAAQARREGFTEDENYKINVAYKKDILLADLYQAKLSFGKDKLYIVPEDEVNAVWANAENEKLFNRDITTLREIQRTALEAQGRTVPPAELKGDLLETARKNWARTKILSDKAKADAEFINQPEIGLRLKIVEAGILSNDYLRANADKLKVTASDISEYLAAHPEYDEQKKLEKAEMVFAKVKNGGDFEKLAAEYSEDRTSKDKGGLYKDVAENALWSEVENAVSGLKTGQIADHLIESRTGYHIVKLIDKKAAAFSFKQILIQKKFEEPGEAIPGIPPPFMSAEEIAEAELSKKKRTEFVEKIIAQNPVSLPEDFTFELPKIEKDSANSN